MAKFVAVIRLRMVREGMTVVYPQYLNGCAANKAQYLQAEREAKREGLGVWNRANPLKVMPWKFRRKGGGPSASPNTTSWLSPA